MESKGELVTLNYKVSLGKDVQSRAGASDLAVNKLLCVVYENGKTENNGEVLRQIVNIDNEGKAEFKPNLFTTISYRVAFWAYYDSAEDGADFFDLADLRKIKVSNDYYTTSMDNVYKDAFTFVQDVQLSTNTGGGSVYLKRPFSQVTLLTSVEDYNNVSNASHLSLPKTSELNITSCQPYYDLKVGQWINETGTISVTSDVSTTTTKTIGEKQYYYLANEYIFAGGSNVKCNINVKNEAGSTIYTNEVAEMPLNPNKSTNMYNENLLLGTVNYSIEIDQSAFGNSDNNINQQ